ncbi:cytosolic endo-beta-N-acetylglucosaminidase [Manduca sexta]|uniref:Cytosolic endo-beta-N-acetylglucosaminidase TIM barrel domain-containing protein n=1 Tax=Manduca sexta TaxID=7130 RepID=A0A922CUF3_MANSE|nr:cytosolic endo-beta-N-acetylglucosaminidase [Manduca sexta]KAG6458328.1 hypothetical protein O3G_MSEX010796 [Manduca sexta]
MKVVWKDELTCKPLDTYNEILSFLEDPPPWRSLCKELTPHSELSIRNTDINKQTFSVLEAPETFCHFNPDAEEVRRHDAKTLPKTLVCHDMANGYHDDCVIDGTGQHDAYTFYNWSGIDIFCYFSHHLITIPPLGWINVGHAHGVKVIGTVITEWAEGVVFWDKILDSEVEYQNFASALVAIAKTLKFDGWLLNVENKIAKPDALLAFVQYLHRALHEELPAPVLVWYDSVTVQGNLNWQNGLNEKNKAFFDACDAFFTNYSWSEANIKTSVETAGERLTDLYIGIDVWGRNFYGGGQFNVQAAVRLAHTYGCSLAIFAPAWTHESLSEEKGDLNSVAMADGLDRYGQFLLRDRALWGSIWKYLNTRLPSQLPFQTSFCKGQGLKRRLYGEVLCPVPWYNLRHMHYQPNSAHGPHGYLLSTVDNILHISCHEVRRDQSGAIVYNESFQMSRLELHSVSKDLSILPKADSLLAINEEDEGSDEVDEERPKSVKRKMKNAFKHLFMFKSQKTEEEEFVAGPSGRSMVQMSTYLHLGQSAEKLRFGLAHIAEERECLEHFMDDSFIGGSCLKINPSDKLSPDHRLTRLFHCDFQCEESLIACVVTKTVMGFQEQYLNVKLFMKNAKGEDLTVVLVGRSLAQMRSMDSNATGVLNVAPLDPGSAEFREIRKYMLLNQPAFYMPVENSYGWVVRYYELPLPGTLITSVNLRTGLEQGSILLGHFGLCHKLENPD